MGGLAGTVAARYAGTLSDVLRTAVPPRVAKVEKELLAGDFEADVVDLKPATDAHAWASYANGAAYLQHLASGGSPKAVLTALQASA